MNNQRLILWTAFFLMLFFIFNAWQTENLPPPQKQTATAAATQTGISAVPTTTTTNDQLSAPTVSDTTTGQTVHIKTDVLDIIINLQGANIIHAGLLSFPQSLKSDEPFSLLNNNDQRFFIAQSGLIAPEGMVAPNHTNAVFSAPANEFILQDGQDKLVVPLSWQDSSGIKVEKIYTFQRGHFNIQLEQTLHNQSGQVWTGGQYRQLMRIPPANKSSFFMASSFVGGVISSPDNDIIYEKIAFADMQKSRDLSGVGGWLAMIEQYFLAAWIPAQDEKSTFYTNIVNNNQHILGLRSAQLVNVEPNNSHTFISQLFVGPKISEQLAPLAPRLELTIDYGWLSFISEFLFVVLSYFYGLVGNWGWAIVLLTLSIKLLFYPLSEKSYRSMAKMRQFAPELQRLKEQYGDDRQRLSQEMMDLYRKEKINPMSGCWPIMLQIPVFIALYWMLFESVELRQAPWILWITDLSVMDPYFVLPLIMGATMFIQQRLNPAPPDPLQAKIMMYMPIVFTFMFLWFPAGLVLYWVVNNLLSILQQWVITRRIEKAAALAKATHR